MIKQQGLKTSSVFFSLLLGAVSLVGSNPTLARTNNYPDAVKQHYDNASKYTQGVFEAKDLGNKPFKVDFKDKKSKGWSGDVTTVKEVKSRADIHFLGPFVADDKINDLAKFQIKKPGKFKLTLEFWLFKFWKDRAKTESHFSPYINGKTFANYTHKHGQPLSNAPGCKIVQKDVAFWNSGLAGTLVRCTYKGEYLTNKRLVVNGYDVTADNSKTPTSHQFSVKDNSRQPKGTQAWAIKSFEVSFDGMKAAESSDKSKSKKVKHAFEWEVPKKLRMSFVLPKVPPGHPLATADAPQAVTTPHVPHTGQPAQSYPSKKRKRDAYGYGQHLGHEMSHVTQRRRGDSQQWPPGQAPYATYPGPQKFDAPSPVRGGHPLYTAEPRFDYVPPDQTAGKGLDKDFFQCSDCFQEGLSKEFADHCRRECVALSDETAETMDRLIESGGKRKHGVLSH